MNISIRVRTMNKDILTYTVHINPELMAYTELIEVNNIGENIYSYILYINYTHCWKKIGIFLISMNFHWGGWSYLLLTFHYFNDISLSLNSINKYILTVQFSHDIIKSLLSTCMADIQWVFMPPHFQLYTVLCHCPFKACVRKSGRQEERWGTKKISERKGAREEKRRERSESK